jgi:hypothetical protein
MDETLISAALIAELTRLKTEVDELKIFCLPSDNRIRIQYICLCTMIDGKAMNAAMRNFYSGACPVCHARPVDMSTHHCPGFFEPKDGGLDHGCSPLHFGIRSFEFFCHIGFNQEFKEWQARGPNKVKKERMKQHIKLQAEKEIGIKIFQVSRGRQH